MPGALLGLPAPPARGTRAARRRRSGCSTTSASRRRADDLARNLPYGDQRRLEIARAIATGPSVLLLDEPAAGMNPSEKRDAHRPDPRASATPA